MKADELEKLIGRLLHQHGAALRLYAMTWSQEPDDCVQQAMIRFASEQSRPVNPVAWLYRVVRNEAISRSRSERRRRRRENVVASQRSAFQVSADNGLEVDELMSALNELDSSVREIVVARIWGGLNFEEIGQAAGCSSSTAHRRYQAGLEQMRQSMAQTHVMKDDL